MVPQKYLLRPAFAAMVAVTLAGCASIPTDRGFSDVARNTAERGLTLPQGDAATLTRELLASPINADNATTLAFLNNPRVRLTASRLGFAAADVYDAARLSNPVLSLLSLSSNDPAALTRQVTGSVALSFTDLLLLPARSRYAKSQFESAKLEVARTAQSLASEVESAWFELAAARQALALRQRVAQASTASAQLAQRYFDAGNINKRELALERSAAAQATLDVQAAEAEALAAYSRLNRLMGLPAQTQWTMAGGLPSPLDQEDPLADLLKLSLESRLDVAAARQSAQAIADAYGLTRRLRLLGPVQAGYEVTREFDNSRSRGPSLSFELPLFNWGTGRVARAQAELDAAEAQLAGLELDVSNEVTAAHTALLNAKARVENFQTQLIPQREAVVQQMQLEVNYMIIGVFELLAAKQQEYDAYAGYLDAVRDYWLARISLAQAVGRQLPSKELPASTPLDALELTTPKQSGGHGGMNHGAGAMTEMDHSADSMPGMEGMDMSEPPKPQSSHEGHQP